MTRPSEVHSSPQKEPTGAPAVPQKRGPGRPRRVPLDQDDPQAIKRPRGRPMGSTGSVTQSFSTITKQHFAFVRAVVNGLPIRNAWRIYMTTPDSDEPTQYEMASLYRSTAQTILEIAQTHQNISFSPQKLGHQNEPQADFSVLSRPRASQQGKTLKSPDNSPLADHQGKPEKLNAATVRQLVNSLAQLPQQAIRTEEFTDLPSSASDVLEFHEFEASFPESNTAMASSQSEIRDAYRRYLERLGKETIAATLLAEAPRERKLSAINAVENLLSVGPRPDSPCGLWLSPLITALLQENCDVQTLGDLCLLITNSGVTWHRRVKGIGASRSRELQSWLNQQKHLSALLPRSGLKRSSGPRKESQTIDSTNQNIKQFGLVPLELLATPGALDGSYGRFRSPHQNTFGANTDLQGIQAWLKMTDSSVTRRSYEKEATRFYLWCLLVKGKALSDLDATDCADYRSFLSSIPSDWIMNAPYPRGNAAWRPFIGQLSKRSQSYALKVVGILFNALHQSAYLQANAMREVAKAVNAQDDDIDTTRTLNEQAREQILKVLNAMPDNALNRRKKAIFELATRTGLRRTEIAAATWGDLTPASFNGRMSNDFELKVIGKGGKVRKVPVMAELVKLLREHQADAVRLSVLAPEVVDDARPLIAALEKPVHQIDRRSNPTGEQSDSGIRNPIDHVTEFAAPNGALSAHGLYQTIRSMFREVARSNLVPEDERHLFLKASIHWFRHTFAHAVIEGTHGDLSVTQDLLGHASLQTTGKYLKQDGSARMKAARLASVVLSN